MRNMRRLRPPASRVHERTPTSGIHCGRDDADRIRIIDVVSLMCTGLFQMQTKYNSLFCHQITRVQTNQTTGLVVLAICAGMP
jgi:hypothetical protein